jgi:Na+:H+ antiporter, NhaA family
MDQNSPDPRPRSFLFGGGSSSELLRIGSILRQETVGGALLVTAALIALIWANSPLSAGYFELRDIRLGYGPWDLELSLGEWASDGLLAIFFFPRRP